MARKKLPPELKAKNHTFKLYDWEVDKVKGFIKKEREEYKLGVTLSPFRATGKYLHKLCDYFGVQYEPDEDEEIIRQRALAVLRCKELNK